MKKDWRKTNLFMVPALIIALVGSTILSKSTFDCRFQNAVYFFAYFGSSILAGILYSVAIFWILRKMKKIIDSYIFRKWEITIDWVMLINVLLTLGICIMVLAIIAITNK